MGVDEVADVVAVEPVDTGDGYIPGATFSTDWYRAHVARDNERRRQPQRLPWPELTPEPVTAPAPAPEPQVPEPVLAVHAAQARSIGGRGRMRATVVYHNQAEANERELEALIKAGLFEMIDGDDEVESGTGFEILLGADGKIAGFEVAER